MINLSIKLYLLLWLFISGALFIIPELSLGPNAASYYSNIIQIASSAITAILCWRTMLVFEHNDPMRLVWLLIGAGVFSWCIGEILYAGYIFIHSGAETPYPWYSDIGFLLIQPLIIIALFIFTRAIAITPPTWGIILSIIVLIIALTISIKTSYENLLQASSDVERLAEISYMLFDPILIFVTVLTASVPGSGQLAYPWWFCFVGLTMYYLSNVVFNIQTAQEIYISGTWTDLGWPLSFTLIGMSAMLVYNMLHHHED